MRDFESIDDILDFAMNNEQTAADFYFKLAKEAKNQSMADTFTKYAKEEMGHKSKLKKIKEGKGYTLKNENVSDLKISDYLVVDKTEGEMTYENALILAMKREKAAYKLYMKLSAVAPTTELEIVFRDLAIEEAKHKLKFELEYDDLVYREN